MSQHLGALAGRIAAAPISWGVCEVPGWGVMLPQERVLPEMRSLGLRATELGAPGFLPDTGPELNNVLDEHGMSLIGGFVPLVLHDPARRPEALERARAAAELFAAAGATRFVTAAVQDYDWPRPTPLDERRADHLAESITQVGRLCADFGLVQVLHPHVDTLVETAADVELVLHRSTVSWCLDTGHLQIGGMDPAQFARSWADRVGHVHLKDVDDAIARRVVGRELSLVTGVQAGLFTPLGDGDVAVDEVVIALEDSGYAGWYVLEQDTALTVVPSDGAGPIDAVRQSLRYLSERVVGRTART